ncbi:MAG: hypothetical protein LBB09_03885 [Rickettsiales bacterium]|jgi:folylpolyglutamate synthase/dihydrofolate synthase|nr:hypothetical protein [Rickettsiales bacterium]
MKEEKFLDIIKDELRAGMFDILDKIILGRNYKNLDKLAINQALLMNRFDRGYSALEKFLLKHGASRKLAFMPLSNLGNSIFYSKNNDLMGFDYFYTSDRLITKRMLRELGNPEKKIGPVIHVTGSNGKGSTATFLESLFRENGYKVNKFISPCIVRNNEEIVLNGEEISDEEYYEHITQVKEIYDRVMGDEDFVRELEEVIDHEIENHKISKAKKGEKHITVRVFLVPAMILSFLKHKADVNIIEVYVGGLEDHTNIFTENEILATVATAIRHGIGSNDDLMRRMGENGKWFNSNKTFAYHKAMLSRSGRPMVTANQLPDVLEEIRRVAKENGAYTVEYGRDWFAESDGDGGFTFRGFGRELKLKISKKLIDDDYQILNMSTALATVFSQDKFKIEEASAQRVLDGASPLIGRLKICDDGFYRKYFGKNCNVIAGFMKNGDTKSIEKIFNSLEGDVYIAYTTGSAKSKGKHKIFFELLKNYANVKRLIIYKYNEEEFKNIIDEAVETRMAFSTANYLAIALRQIKDEMDPKKKNNVFILHNSIISFDKNIILLDKII